MTTTLHRNLSVSESRSLLWSQVCTSWLDHDDTLQTAAPAAAAVVLAVLVVVAAVGDVSTDPLCDVATHCCDDDANRLSLPPTHKLQVKSNTRHKPSDVAAAQGYY